MHFLLDREFIARDIYRGLAVPMTTHVSPQDHDYLTIYDIERASGIAYDPEYARELIEEAMLAANETVARFFVERDLLSVFRSYRSGYTNRVITVIAINQITTQLLANCNISFYVY